MSPLVLAENFTATVEAAVRLANVLSWISMLVGPETLAAVMSMHPLVVAVSNQLMSLRWTVQRVGPAVPVFDSQDVGVPVTVYPLLSRARKSVAAEDSWIPVVQSAVADAEPWNWHWRTMQLAAVTVTMTAVVVMPVCGHNKIMFSRLQFAAARARVEPAAVSVSVGRAVPNPSPMIRVPAGMVIAPVLTSDALKMFEPVTFSAWPAITKITSPWVGLVVAMEATASAIDRNGLSRLVPVVPLCDVAPVRLHTNHTRPGGMS